jgi:hypothetical protein
MLLFHVLQEIVDDWTDGTSMVDGQSEMVTFTCDDLTVGVYSAVFNVNSDEYTTGDQVDVSCEILLVPAYGVSLTDPIDLVVDNVTNAVYTITVTNTGNMVDNYTLYYTNVDAATTVTLVH